MNSEPSFGRMAIRTAWANSRLLLQSRLQSGLVALISLIVGIGVQSAIAGFSPTTRSILIAIVSAFVVAIVLFVSKFIWHLFLAPNEIVYGAIRPLLENTPAFGIPRPTNYSIWKKKRIFTAGEFAALLAGMDPSSPASTVDSQSYLKLLLDDLRANDLKYSRPPGVAPEGYYYPDMGTVIAKDDAFAWADARGFGPKISQLREPVAKGVA